MYFFTLVPFMFFLFYFSILQSVYSACDVGRNQQISRIRHQQYCYALQVGDSARLGLNGLKHWVVSLFEKERQSFLWQPRWDALSLLSGSTMAEMGNSGQCDCLSHVITTPCLNEPYSYAKAFLSWKPLFLEDKNYVGTLNYISLVCLYFCMLRRLICAVHFKAGENENSLVQCACTVETACLLQVEISINLHCYIQQ